MKFILTLWSHTAATKEVKNVEANIPESREIQNGELIFGTAFLFEALSQELKC